MKKVLGIAKTVFTWALVIAAVAMMIFTIVSVSTFDRSDRSLFGYKAFIVLSDSMSSTNGDTSKGYFNAGDLVLAKEVDPSTLKAGDIISYTSTNSENFGKTVTHMIKGKTVTSDGKPAFITYGTATGAEDSNAVAYDYILGKYKTHIPKVGVFFRYLKSTPGYIVCILIPFLLLILMQGINSIKIFKKYKAEQLAEIEAQRQKERDEIERERELMKEERARQEEMMQKLLKMQELLNTDEKKESPAAEDEVQQ